MHVRVKARRTGLYRDLIHARYTTHPQTVSKLGFGHYALFLVINTTHSTCHDTSEMMSNGGILVKSVLGKESNVDFRAWEEVCFSFQSAISAL